MTHESPGKFNGEIRNSGHYHIHGIHPVDIESDCPGHLPDNLEKLFAQAESAAQDAAKADSTAMICRRILDNTVTIVAPNAKGDNLKQKIDWMADNHKITPDLRDWAHEIRLIGNDATHELDLVPQSEAQDIFEFTKLFLMYIFTLPGMLAARRKPPEETT